MPHRRPRVTADDDVDVDVDVLQRLDADVCAALEYLCVHANEIPGGTEIAECLTRHRRRRPGPAGVVDPRRAAAAG